MYVWELIQDLIKSKNELDLYRRIYWSLFVGVDFVFIGIILSMLEQNILLNILLWYKN